MLIIKVTPPSFMKCKISDKFLQLRCQLFQLASIFFHCAEIVSNILKGLMHTITKSLEQLNEKMSTFTKHTNKSCKIALF